MRLHIDRVDKKAQEIEIEEEIQDELTTLIKYLGSSTARKVRPGTLLVITATLVIIVCKLG
jgi:hypothetical protein